MGCLDANTVVDLVEGRLSGGARDQVDDHLASCPTCRRLVARTAEALVPSSGEAEEPAPLPAPLRGLRPGDRVGRYRVLNRVGAGAMGVVYAAEDPDLRRKVALKLLRSHPQVPLDKMHARLLREARAAGAIRHPNVVPVHDVLSLEDGSPVLVMDLLHGEPLRARLDRVRRLSLQETCSVMIPVLSALEAAHPLGVVHRDLKPDNIFLARNDRGELDVKIVDFGVAKLMATEGAAGMSAGRTETGIIVGTPYYMAPEQAFGESDIDHRADLWAVGVILYECLAGVRPTDGSNVGQVLKTIARLSFPSIHEVAPGLPPDAAGLISNLLRDRDERTSSAGEVRAAMEILGRGEAPDVNLVNSNSNLVGAEPGAEPDVNLVNSNSNLVGAEPDANLVNSNSNLVGAEPGAEPTGRRMIAWIGSLVALAALITGVLVARFAQNPSVVPHRRVAVRTGSGPPSSVAAPLLSEHPPHPANHPTTPKANSPPRLSPPTPTTPASTDPPKPARSGPAKLLTEPPF